MPASLLDGGKFTRSAPTCVSACPEANVHSTFPLDFAVWSTALDVKDTKKSR